MYFINDENRCFWATIPFTLSIIFLICFFVFLVSMIKETNNMVLFLILMVICLIISLISLFLWLYISKIYKETNKIKEMIDDKLNEKYNKVMNIDK